MRRRRWKRILIGVAVIVTVYVVTVGLCVWRLVAVDGLEAQEYGKSEAMKFLDLCSPYRVRLHYALNHEDQISAAHQTVFEERLELLPIEYVEAGEGYVAVLVLSWRSDKLAEQMFVATSLVQAGAWQ